MNLILLLIGRLLLFSCYQYAWVTSLAAVPRHATQSHPHPTTRYYYDVSAPSTTTMIPLSSPPLLLLQSSTPIIDKEACILLSNYFDDDMQNKKNSGDILSTIRQPKQDRDEKLIAERLLEDIQSLIDRVTNCPQHDDEMQIPRYVRYDASAVIDSTDDDKYNNILFDEQKFGDLLLPDGLHVDTNNGKLFRHLTAILYLTDNAAAADGCSSHSNNNNELRVGRGGGGTTFPLATPINHHHHHHHHHHIMNRVANGYNLHGNNLQHAAERLLDNSIEHTKRDTYHDNPYSDGRILEKAAMSVFYRDNNTISPLFNSGQYHINNRYSSDDEDDNNMGIRVMPEAGKLIYFHNVNDDGYPDPLSFHGGEELITIITQGLGNDNDNRSQRGISSNDTTWKSASSSSKSILVFFKEIPVQSFAHRGREGFAEEAAKSRKWTEDMYYSTTTM